MSEWLTTVEVIGKLKIGEIAEPDDGNKSERILKRGDGSIVWKYNTDKFVHLNQAVMLTKWRILLNYVSFEEAMKALKEGKEVRYYPSWNQSISYLINPEEANGHGIQGLKLKDESLLQVVFDSKWTIEE